MGRLHDLRLVIRNDFKKDEKTRTSFGQFIQTNAKKIKTRINIPLSLDGLEHSSFLSYFSNIEGKNPNYKLWHNYLKEIDNLFNTHYADSRALRNYILDYDNKVQLERLVILKKELKPEISPLAEKFIIYVGDQSQVAKAQVIIEEARGHGKSHKITIPAHNPAASHSR
jgi:hypothetical protein